MANQFNYPDPLLGSIQQRPSRVAQQDLALMEVGEKQVLFGTTDNDVIEIWVYNADGSFAGHMNVRPTDPTISLTTLVDQSGAHESLNVNVTEVITNLSLDPGRYSVTMNLFRNEVGSEEGYRLFITDISEDRTEVRLHPVKVTPDVLLDLYEFTEPSVPRLAAQALIDKILGFSLIQDDNNSITEGGLNADVDFLLGNTINRLQYAGVYHIYLSTAKQILERTKVLALNFLSEDTANAYVQQVDIERYMFTALNQAIAEFTEVGLDPRFLFVENK